MRRKAALRTQMGLALSPGMEGLRNLHSPKFSARFSDSDALKRAFNVKFSL
jgi:hypothetical protein